jgi:hypothetical protein
MDWRIEVRSPAGAEIFLFTTVFIPGAHPASYPMTTGGSFLGGKPAGA